MSPWRIRHYVQSIEHGAVFAYPTDTIWGLGCHPSNQEAIQRVQQIKRRSPRKGLILLSNDFEYCRAYVDDALYNHYCSLLSQSQPKPTTWILQASESCPQWLTGSRETVAIRITQASLIEALCGELKHPLVSTSANRSGEPPSRNSYLIHKHFRQHVDFIIDGFDTGTKKASEIRDAKNGIILRQ